MPKIALCSKHHKGALIAPVLEELGYALEELSEFDTDTLGTFSGEIERTLAPNEAALVKAKKACELSGAQFGLGSEGSFGGGPMPGIINWNEEILCLYDMDTQRAVYAMAADGTGVTNIEADSLPALKSHLERHDGQRWIYRDEQIIQKALSRQALETMAADGSLSFPLSLEPDLRAMYCPQRQEVIRKAALDLLDRLKSCCSQCQANNFVVNQVEQGLPCQWCSLPTKQIKSRSKVCDVCGYTETIPAEVPYSEPTYCDFCNP